MIYIKILIFILFSDLAHAENKSLSCSQNGLLILFVNGINNLKTQVEVNTKLIEDLVKAESAKFDNKSQIDVNFSYNSRESFKLDLLQLVAQKLKENKFHSDDIPHMLATFTFSKLKFSLLVGVGLMTEINDEELKLLTKQKYQSELDTSAMTEKVLSALNSDKKVILLSHSQGNIYANRVYNDVKLRIFDKQKLDKFFANFQIASVASHSLSKNHLYYTLKSDRAVSLFSFFTSKPVAPRNHSISLSEFCTFTGEAPDYDFCHDFRRVYLSDSLKVTGPKQGHGYVELTAKKFFLEGLEELAWKLANNDESCCEGRDGRLYRPTYKDAPGGFVESSVTIQNKSILEIDSDSQICGSPYLSSATSHQSENIFKIKLINTQIKKGTPVDIRGNVLLKDSFIEPTNPEKSLTIEGKTVQPLTIESSVINGSPSISGATYLDQVYIEGDSNISGNRHFAVTPTFSGWIIPRISNNQLYENNTISGFYDISRDLINTDVIGFVQNSPAEVVMTTIDPHTFAIEDGYLSGLIHVFGRVKKNVTMAGSVLTNSSNTHYGGINISSGTTIGEDSVMSGAGYFNSTEYSGNFSGSIDPLGYVTNITGGKLVNVSVSGAPYISGSELTGGSVSDFARVFSCKQTGSSFSCDAEVYGEMTDGNSYGCGYVTGSSMRELQYDDGTIKNAQRSASFVDLNLKKSKYYNELFYGNEL